MTPLTGIHRVPRFAQSSPGSTLGHNLRSTRTRSGHWIKLQVASSCPIYILAYLTCPYLDSPCLTTHHSSWKFDLRRERLAIHWTQAMHLIWVFWLCNHMNDIAHITYRVDEFPPRLLLASFMGSSCSVVGFRGGLKCSVCRSPSAPIPNSCRVSTLSAVHAWASWHNCFELICNRLPVRNAKERTTVGRLEVIRPPMWIAIDVWSSVGILIRHQISTVP